MTDSPTILVRSALQLLGRLLVAAAVLGMLAAYSMYFPVSEGQAAVVTRFGNPLRQIVDPGPHFKCPWPVEQVHLVDIRSRVFNTPYTATFTRDRKNVILLTYIVWRPTEPLLFLQSVGTPESAEKKLDGMVTAAKTLHLGSHDLSARVSIRADDIQTESIEAAILASVAPAAREKFGIEVEQIGILRIAYPEENVRAVLAQMRAERKAEADRMRAEGERVAQGIRDDALVQSQEILRKAREEAGRIRGKAEKETAEIYATAHRLDPDFYRYWRSLEALKRSLGAKATVILRTDQGFFNVLADPPRPQMAPSQATPTLVTPPVISRPTNASQGVSP